MAHTTFLKNEECAQTLYLWALRAFQLSSSVEDGSIQELFHFLLFDLICFQKIFLPSGIGSSNSVIHTIFHNLII